MAVSVTSHWRLQGFDVAESECQPHFHTLSCYCWVWREMASWKPCHSLMNSLRSGDEYIRHWTGPSLFRVMACRLFGAKPLPVPEQWWFIVNWILTNNIQSNCIWKCRLPKWRPSCLGLSVLTHLLLFTVAGISQSVFSYAFSWMRSCAFWLRFSWICS